MKKLFACAVALGLFAAVPAMAAPNDHNGGKHDAAPAGAQTRSGGGGGHQNAQPRAAAGVAHAPASVGAFQNGQGHAMMGQSHTRSVGTYQNTQAAGAVRTRSVGTRQSTPVANTMNNRYLPASGDSHQGTTGRSATVRNRGNSGMSANAAVQHRSINSLRVNVQASHQYHDGAYRQPRGYQARHWGYGERLPHLYFARDYWLTDYLDYGLFAPPDGLIWVRVGDDALLIDEESGDIVQVDYGVFY